MNVTRIYIDLPPKIVRPRKRDDYKTPEAPHYCGRLGSPDGEILVNHTPTPVLDAARALAARGITGILEMWDSERPYARLRGDIQEMAGLTVIETDKVGPYFAKYVPFPGRGMVMPAGGKVK